ncbi:MAG TPA: L,D-transpeptidase family protein [Gaiellaceae bacterium]
MRHLALLLSVVVALAAAATAAADTPPVVPAGVVLGGIPIGGLTSDAATALVVQRFSRPVTLKVGRQKVTVDPASLGVTIWADTAVAKALTVPAGTSLGFRALFSRARVASYVAGLARRMNRDPSSARLLLRNYRPLVKPSQIGLRIQQGATVALLSDELGHGTRTPVAVPIKTITPQSASIGSVVVIRRASNLLTLYRGDHYVRQFHVATGQAVYPTPLGSFHIVVKWENPTWYPPTQDAWAKGLKPVPPGPNNPLGTRWMGIDSPGVGIHGTDEPASIGYSESHGCIRMLVPDAEWLFAHVSVGTPVFIVAS